MGNTNPKHTMSTRTVRLDAEAENALEEVRAATGLTISEALKRGLTTLQRELRGQADETAWDAYTRLDLGPGGYAVAPADAGPDVVRAVIERRVRP